LLLFKASTPAPAAARFIPGGISDALCEIERKEQIMKSKRIIAVIAAIILGVAIIMPAEQGRVAAQSNVGLAPILTFEGVVENVDMAVSQEFPTFTLSLPDNSKVTIITGPYYYLLDSGFEIRVGDRLSVRAFLSLWYENTYVAVEITNLSTGETLVLRDAAGRPLWTNQGGPGNGGMGNCHGCGGGPVNIATFEGIVVSVDMACSQQYPSFTLALADGSKIIVMTGPYHYLVESGFVITVGDRVTVRALRSLWPDNTYTAVEITNLTTGATITMRTDDGKPLWMGQGGPGGPGGRMGDCSGWIPPNGGSVNIVTLEGTVLSLDMAAGQEFPTFTLSLPGVGVVTIVTGPYYFLLDSGFDIAVGDRLSVRAFESAWYEDTYVAVELKNLTTGETLVLRDASGQPVWPRSQQHADRGQGYGGGAAWFEVDSASLSTIKGPVRDMNTGIGEGYASYTVVKSGNRFTILAGPYRFMLENSFEVREGHRIKVRAYRLTRFDNLYVAVSIKNLATGKSLTLRDENGNPLWNNRRP
ncbi:MAG TPA: hypothetical protein VFQ92_21165, partial [Blastocatellia bacterium]|nr:hypothetical protein [Blastocatellia bacterium]